MYIYTISYSHDVFLTFEELKLFLGVKKCWSKEPSQGACNASTTPFRSSWIRGLFFASLKQVRMLFFQSSLGLRESEIDQFFFVLDGTWTFSCLMMWHPLKRAWVKPWWPNTAHQAEWTIFQKWGWLFVFWMLRLNRTTKNEHLSNLKGSEWFWWSSSGFMVSLSIRLHGFHGLFRETNWLDILRCQRGLSHKEDVDAFESHGRSIEFRVQICLMARPVIA